MEDQRSFGQRVRACRRETGLTQEELAHRVGCAPITLRKIEHDDLRPSLQIAERLAMALCIPLEERADFIRLARSERGPEPVSPTPAPRAEEIGLDDLSGRAIRGYALGERIGAGGMGVVYRATQPLVEREVALKIILPQYANQPDFIRRFEAEAQLVARLEHPHIVPLYDYWREPGVAYLVMRLLRGGSARARLEQGPLPLEMVDLLLEQISQALSAAHRIGIIHRDLKPANILLDEDGNAYLSDFGIAKAVGNFDNLTQVDAIVGSPNYISPEQIRSESISPQTDIYCLGVTLYELLTGSLPFYGPTPVVVMYKHITTPLPPLLPQRPDLPAGLDQVIAQATAKDPLDRFPDAEAFFTAWRQALGRPWAASAKRSTYTQPLTEADNPYKGLRAFSEGDAADFFGRDALVQQLLARMGDPGDLSRFLAVVGPSGCGKSSVVKAGLIPALRRGGLPGSEKWFIVELMPGAHPLEELEAALLRIAANPPESLVNQLREDKRGLLRAVRRCLPDDPEVDLLLVIDQFEELFTLVPDEAERAHLLDSLVTAVLDERSRLRLVVTLRADFIDRPLNYVDFGEMLRQRMELVLPFTPDELERAILGPAERLGLEWEPGLVAQISHDVGDQPGALPLLQFALTGLFERREGRRLTLAAYQSLGGVLGALGGRAEEVFRQLEPPAQSLARQVFLRLATLGEGVGDGTLSPDTRRRVLREELDTLKGATAQQGASLPAVIDAFGRSRLLAFDRDPLTRGPTVEVAHEALLREWVRLRDWLSASRSDVRLQRHLAAAAAEWESTQRDPGYLLVGPRLAQFEGWASSTDVALTQAERAYLDASLACRQAEDDAETERQRRELEAARKLAESEKRRAEEQTRAAGQLRGRNRIITVVGILALAAAIVAAVFGVNALASFDQADRLRLSAEAARLLAVPNGNAETAALLSVRALHGGYLLQADETLQQSAPALFAIHTLQGHTDEVAGVAFSPDGKMVLTGSIDNTARLWDAASGTPLRTFKGHTTGVGGWAGVTSVAFSPDGKYVLTGSYDQTAKLWDAASGAEVRTFKGHDYAVSCVAFSPDGKYVLTGSFDRTAKLWDAATGAVLFTLSGHNGGITSVVFSQDGKWILTASSDGTAILWETVSGSQVRTFTPNGKVIYGETNWINVAVLSPDGRYMLSGNQNGTATLWDATTAAEVRSFTTGYNGSVTSAAFSPDGKYALLGSTDGIAELLDVASGTMVRSYKGHTHAVISVAFSPDGKMVLTGSTDHTAKLWLTTNRETTGAGNQVIAQQVGRILSVNFFPDGKRVLSANDQGDLWAWNASEAKGTPFTGVDSQPINTTAFSPDGKVVATVNGANYVTLWDAASGAETSFLSGSQGGFSCAAFSPDGKYVVAGDWNMNLTLWDFATQKQLRVFNGHKDSIMSLAFSPDGKEVLSGSWDNTARLWDTATGASIRTINGHNLPVLSVAFSPDGKTLLTASLDGTVKLWDAATGAEVRTISAHANGVLSAAFSPDGKYILTGGRDNTARLWQTATGAEVRIFSGHTGWVNSVAFSPDGKSVVTGSDDGTVRVWMVDFHTSVEWACTHLTRDLTDEERKAYGITDTIPTCPVK